MTFCSRLARVVAFSALLAVPAGALTGCSATNPSQINSPYAAADGANGEIHDPVTGGVVKLRNFLLVGTAAGKPAQLVGAIANEGSAPVRVELSISAPVAAESPAAAASAAPTAATLVQVMVSAAPGQLTLVGPGGTAVDVAALPAIPGATVTLLAKTSAGGQTMSIPVVAATGQYASLPAGSPAASASASAG